MSEISDLTYQKNRDLILNKKEDYYKKTPSWQILVPRTSTSPSNVPRTSPKDPI